MADEDKRPFLFLVGPTASGKSALAMRLAKQLGFPIVNFDSLQVYKRLDIGSAKPSLQERQDHPHLLYDFVPPPQVCTAALYLEALQEVLHDPRWPGLIFVGGSGFYLQAIEKGLFSEASPNPQIREEAKKWLAEAGAEALHAWIKTRDPQAAAKIQIQDHYRLVRAVEILKGTGETLTEKNRRLQVNSANSALPPHWSFKIGLRGERELLLQRVERRTSEMLASGWLDEVQSLLQDGFQDWPPLASVGYREVADFLIQGGTNRPALQERIVTRTMQLCKKQRTWFQRDQEIQWHHLSEQDRAAEAALKWCASLKI